MHRPDHLARTGAVTEPKPRCGFDWRVIPLSLAFILGLLTILAIWVAVGNGTG